MRIKTEKSIFLKALDIEKSDARGAYLKEACGDDPELLSSVAELLREHDRENHFVDCPIASVPRDDVGTTGIIPPDSELLRSSILSLGATIGPYTLREQIGEGGFGLVFVADQDSPVRRRVALKIIKPGMESREVLARFEAERQALALMDHPNIARVFDAGVTQNGQPYFVMELVRGIPLCEFCDKRKLTTRDRLQLFVSICYAVQHAHQKGIIHRDLKPSNVLVTLLDGKPLAKVIDFGVAKAIGQSLTGKTIYTRFASMIGTPAYMSPEQAEMSAVDIDTRADIYSLGVLLYELLTGSTPFERDRLDSAGFDELRRIIREEEPPRPSVRLNTLTQELASTVSAARQVEPSRISSQVKGDLDWVVMKAIDKDRNRRYATASALAEDVCHFLENEPVEARPPSSLYRFSKFARRNRAVLTTVSLVVTSLVVGTIVSVWQARVAWHESREKALALDASRDAEARANTLNQELEQFTERLKQANIHLTSGGVHAESERWLAAHTDYTKATELQPRYYHVWIERARFYTQLGLWDLAASDFAKALELEAPVDGPEWWGVSELFWFAGQKEAYVDLCSKAANTQGSGFRRSFAIRGCLAGEMRDVAAADLAEQADTLLAKAESPSTASSAEAKRSTEDSPKRRRPSGVRIPIGPTYYVAGWAHFRAGNYQRALKRFEQSTKDRHWRWHGIAYPLIAMSYHELGQEDDAANALRQSQSFLDEQLSEAIKQSRVAPRPPWFDWIDFLINFQEAHIVLKGTAFEDDPRTNVLRKRAMATIR